MLSILASLPPQRLDHLILSLELPFVMSNQPCLFLLEPLQEFIREYLLLLSGPFWLDGNLSGKLGHTILLVFIQKHIL